MDNNSYYRNKYLKYKQKYLASKQIQYGGNIRKFNVKSSFLIDEEFINKMKKELNKRGWNETNELPCELVFLHGRGELDKDKDAKGSELLNRIKGKTYDLLMDNYFYIKTYKYQYFIHPYKEFYADKIFHVDKEYRLMPVINKSGENLGNYTSKIIKSRDEIDKEIAEHPEYKKWILKDLLSQPVLKDGHVFQLNFLFIVKLNPLRIYIAKKKTYSLAKLMFDKNNYYTDNNIHGTVPSQNELINNRNYEGKKYLFPEDVPDGWTIEQAEEMNTMIENIIPIIFGGKIDLRTTYNSKKGYFIFNAPILLYEDLPPINYGIYNNIYPYLYPDMAQEIISILLDDKPDYFFKEFKIGTKPIEYNNYNSKYNFERQYSPIKRRYDKNIKNTYYIDVNYLDFHEELEAKLALKGYIESKNFPVKFIFLSATSAFYRNRFDTKRSIWINLLYGNSKLEITNKVLLHKKFGDAEFFIPAVYITKGKQLPEIEYDKLRILKPLNGFAGAGIKIVNNKKEIEEWILINNNYDDWILEDYLVDPDLKDGYKFHFRVCIIVKATKNKKIEVYISNIKFFRKALKKYHKGDWLDKDIHDTHYKPGKLVLFPEELPDGWTIYDANKSIDDMEKIIIKIFKDQKDFYPDWNAINGFEIFGADFIFSNKKTYLLEINQKASMGGCYPIIPGVLALILENKEIDFKKLL